MTFLQNPISPKLNMVNMNEPLDKIFEKMLVKIQ